MKKKKLIVLLSLVVLLVTGCSVKKLDNNNLASNVKYLLSSKSSIYNVYFEGYKYYVPKGVRFIDKDEYNAKLYDNYGNTYYLYVDAIAYYNKTDIKYKIHNKSHFSKALKYNKKNGYLQIDKIDNKYFVQYMFNYTKIEAYVTKESLTDAITNMSLILKSVKYNDKVLESLIGNNILSYKEEKYSLFNTKSSSSTFLDVVEKYEDDAYKQDLEDEKITLDDE